MTDTNSRDEYRDELQPTAQLERAPAREPSTYATAALALLVVVFIAAAWPARVATRVEPVEAALSQRYKALIAPLSSSRGSVMPP
jgi:hypothetical protein